MAGWELDGAQHRGSKLPQKLPHTQIITHWRSACWGCRHIADNGDMVRPWCPATRLLDHREAEALNAKAEAAKKAGMTDSRFSEPTVPLRNDFPALDVSSDIPPAQA